MRRPQPQRKFEVGKSPLERESAISVIKPRDATTRATIIKIIDDQILRLRSADAPEEEVKAKRDALVMYKNQIVMDDQWSSVQFDFVQDFWLWLLGRGKDEDHKKTNWGRSNVAVFDRSVQEYVDSFVEKRHQFALELAKLASKVPTGIAQFYLYFKYVVRGGIKRTKDPQTGAEYWDMADEDFLKDWDVLVREFDNWVDDAEKPNDNDYPAAPFPYGEFLQHQAEFAKARDEKLDKIAELLCMRMAEKEKEVEQRPDRNEPVTEDIKEEIEEDRMDIEEGPEDQAETGGGIIVDTPGPMPPGGEPPKLEPDQGPKVEVPSSPPLRKPEREAIEQPPPEPEPMEIEKTTPPTPVSELPEPAGPKVEEPPKSPPLARPARKPIEAPKGKEEEPEEVEEPKREREQPAEGEAPAKRIQSAPEPPFEGPMLPPAPKVKDEPTVLDLAKAAGITFEPSPPELPPVPGPKVVEPEEIDSNFQRGPLQIKFEIDDSPQQQSGKILAVQELTNKAMTETARGLALSSRASVVTFQKAREQGNQLVAEAVRVSEANPTNPDLAWQVVRAQQANQLYQKTIDVLEQNRERARKLLSVQNKRAIEKQNRRSGMLRGRLLQSAAASMSVAARQGVSTRSKKVADTVNRAALQLVTIVDGERMLREAVAVLGAAKDRQTSDVMEEAELSCDLSTSQVITAIAGSSKTADTDESRALVQRGLDEARAASATAAINRAELDLKRRRKPAVRPKFVRFVDELQEDLAKMDPASAKPRAAVKEIKAEFEELIEQGEQQEKAETGEGEAKRTRQKSPTKKKKGK